MHSASAISDSGARGEARTKTHQGVSLARKRGTVTCGVKKQVLLEPQGRPRNHPVTYCILECIRGISVQPIHARAAIEGIIPSPTDERILSRSALEPVTATSAAELIIAFTTPKDIKPFPAQKKIRSRFAKQPVSGFATNQRVVSIFAVHLAR